MHLVKTISSCNVARITLTAAIAMALSACSDDDDNNAADVLGEAGGTLSFESVKAPETETEKRSILASSSATIDGTDYNIAFNTIIRSGDQAGDGTYGQLFDKNGNAILGEDNSPWISSNNDFASLLTGEDNKLYMVSHFENSPGAMYVTELNQDTDTGKLSPVQTRNIDFSSFNGGWVHCAGSVTPWGTHLGSEEYPTDASKVDASTGHFNDYYGMTQALYFGLTPKAAEDAVAGEYSEMNAYDYGWEIEVAVKDFDDVTSTKHYAMGRVAHELAYVMPNQKTAYISDDGTNVGLFRFEADNAGDLSAGTLYAAKWNQTSDENGGSADLTWVNLGHASNADIKTYLDDKITFNDIFETADAEDETTGTCPTGFTFTNTTDGRECLKVKDGMEKAASRMETRRYAAMLGATTEFRKMEGIAHDPDANVMYLAMSAVERGMEDGFSIAKDSDKYDRGGNNDVRLPLNSCGVVYGLDMDADFVATNMYGVVEGKPVVQSYGAADDSNKYDENGPFAANKCDLDNISNPDNVTFIPGYRTLIIGEDTGSGHQNDIIWSYNLDDKELTRIQTTPFGSETTSPYFYPNLNGWAYMMSVIQHPYGESDEDKLVAGSGADRGYTGYMGPFPAMD